MAIKNLFMIFGLILIVGCSMAAPGSHATADLKDKDGKTVGKAVLRDTADGVLVRLEVKGLTPGCTRFTCMPSANARGRHLPAQADISTRCKESTVLRVPMARTPAICRICS